MCLIVDVNVAARALAKPGSVDYAPVHAWLLGRGRIVHGGRLTLEYAKNRRILEATVEWNRAGRTVVVPQDVIDRETAAVQASGRMRSDDPHVLAVARGSGARTLWTDDAALTDDFRDTQLVPRPRGRVYGRAEHRHLLTHTRGCPFTRAKSPSRSSRRR